MAAFPAQAVIQYDQALVKPIPLPNAARAYAYGPPSAGSRRDSAANISASATAPTVVSAIATMLIGPIDANEYGRLKMPTPMMLPMINAVACGSPRVLFAAGFDIGGPVFVSAIKGSLGTVMSPPDSLAKNSRRASS